MADGFIRRALIALPRCPDGADPERAAGRGGDAGGGLMAGGLIRGALIALRRAQAGLIRIEPPDAAAPREAI